MNSHIVSAHLPASPPAPPMYSTGELTLSNRERLILQLLSEGASNKDAARTLEISPETIKSHMKNIFEKLSVDKRAHAVYKAHLYGLISSTSPPGESLSRVEGTEKSGGRMAKITKNQSVTPLT